LETRRFLDVLRLRETRRLAEVRRERETRLLVDLLRLATIFYKIEKRIRKLPKIDFDL